MVAQIYEQQMSVIALAVNPTGQSDSFADIPLAQLGAVRGAICVHVESRSFARLKARESERGASLA